MTNVVSALTARTQFGQIIKQATQKGERFVVGRRGEPSIMHMGVALIAVAMSSAVAAGDDSWNNIGRVNRERGYSFELRGGECLRGRIEHFRPDSVDIRPFTKPGEEEQSARTLRQNEILRVTDGAKRGEGVIFSNQSSWLDVCGVHAHFREHLRIVLKSGASQTGQPAGCTDSAIKLREAIRTQTFAKANVRQVDYIRIKPESPDTTHFVQEVDGSPLFMVFYPPVWPYVFDIKVHISVRLYDSSVTEDSSPPACLAPLKPRQPAAQK